VCLARCVIIKRLHYEESARDEIRDEGREEVMVLVEDERRQKELLKSKLIASCMTVENIKTLLKG